MNEQLDSAPEGSPAAERHRECQFPLSRDEDSGEFGYCEYRLESTGQGGRPSDYCKRNVLGDDGVYRKHDRITAFQRRRELERGTGPARTASGPTKSRSARRNCRSRIC